MSVENHSVFTIEYKTQADLSGSKDSLSALKDYLEEQKKSRTEQQAGTTVINAAKDATAKLHESTKHGAKEAAESTHKLREALHLVKFEAEGALGPIGELIHLIGNVWVLAIAGLTAAYRMWNEQLEKERENLSKNIELSREQTELFQNAHRTALLNAADAANKFAIEQKHAQDNVDLLTESMKRSIDFAKELKTQTDANAASTDALTNAWIRYGVETGKLTPQEGDAKLEAERRQLRKQKEEAGYAETQAEIDAQTNRAGAARAQSKIAEDQIPALDDQRTKLDEQQIAAEALKKAADEKHAELAKAAADAQAEAQQGPGWLRKHASDLGIDVSVMGLNTPDQQQEFLNKRAADAKTALEQNESVSKNQEALSHKYAHQIAEIDAQIEADRKLAESKLELARTLDEESAASRDHLARQKAADAENDKNTDAARNLDRLTDLHKKIAGGTATDNEQAEYASGTTNNPGAAIAKANAQINGIRNDIRFGGGHATKAQFEQLITLVEELAGLHENRFAQDNQTQSRIDQLQHQVNDLKSTYQVNRPYQ